MRKALVAVTLGFAWLATAAAQPPVDTSIHARIREEAERSQIMRTVQVFTDVYGPRLTGSPSLKAAGEWAVARLESWGLTGGRLEPWDWGRPGWTNERLTAHIVSPVKDQLTAEVVAWTPGTNGLVKARAFQLQPPDRPTRAQLDAYLESVQSNIVGRIVLSGPSVTVPVDLTPPPKRRPDEDVRALFDPARTAGAGGRGGTPQAAGPMAPGEISRRIDDFLVANGALVRINDARREHGQIAVFQNATYDVNRVLPTLMMRNEDYGRVARLLASDLTVELEVDIVNRVHPEGATAYNAVAEIEGTDKRDEIVMMGGHLDSWHAATGATDNAVGCATIMEAARILQALGVRPRRTIRVALWSGEEQGLLGSRAYVREHFGSFENPKADYARLVAYVNMDGGTGRLRGATVFGPAEAGDVLRRMLSPFAGLGVAGAIATRNRNTGGTDHTSFNAAGLPGINFTQDPIEYGTHTHHTNLDTYERVLIDDVKSAAIVIAATVYELAMRDEILPRFSTDEMPPPPRR
jgi:carboxypeptidase Q